MEDSRLTNTVICFPVKRNLYGKIFGGYLMRQAFETAWANAAMFSRCRPLVMAVDSIVFRRSVDVGSLLLLTSQVFLYKKSQYSSLVQIGYTNDRFMQLSVDAQVMDVEKRNCQVALYPWSTTLSHY